MSILNYLLLPSEQTDFEKAHLARSLRVALGFLWCNVPLFMAVAFFNDTGPMSALLLSAAVMVGPTVAHLMLPNARHVSVTIGIAAMCMGGLLVHFGQGPMQIEMHFYFFSILAVLSVFGNPLVILAAAVTVTLHHTVIWWLLPASVFNYDASFYVVLVHAAFVIVESVAAVYIARSFFDNVIGLERKVAERTTQLWTANRAMRLVMEHVNQGLVTIDRAGTMSVERSARVAQWLGGSSSDQMVEYLRDVDPSAAEWFELGFQDLLDGFLPIEVTLEQLPTKVVKDELQLKVEYIPIQDPESVDDFDQILVVLSDVSSEVAQANNEARQRQSIALVHHLLDDPSGVQEFIESGAEMIQAVRSGASTDVARRVVHTLKGNALSLDLQHFGTHLHALEERLQEERREASLEELDELVQQWSDIEAVVERVAPSGDVSVRIAPETIDELMSAVREGVPADVLLQRIASLRHSSPAPRMERMAEQARRLANRLGKEVQVSVELGDVQVPVEELRPLWAALTHAVRNSVDHGIESAEERARVGKPECGHITLSLQQEQDDLVLAVRDDGRGVDWNAVRARAEALGVEVDDPSELLFVDGLSTRTEASLVSGRGVGMSALRDAIQELEGTMTVDSVPGAGTAVIFRMPHLRARAAA